jgi:hydrogenase nickel incorporation protein HypA/HybF
MAPRGRVGASALLFDNCICLRLGPVFIMHEMSIAQSLITILEEEMEKHGAKSLKSVHLHIGQMSAIVPDALSFCFDVITEGTSLEGARLDMEIIPLRALCLECGDEFEVKDYVFLCPGCASTRVESISGQDLSIVEMEVDW